LPKQQENFIDRFGPAYRLVQKSYFNVGETPPLDEKPQPAATLIHTVANLDCLAICTVVNKSIFALAVTAIVGCVFAWQQHRE